jgi:cyanophycinase
MKPQSLFALFLVLSGLVLAAPALAQPGPLGHLVIIGGGERPGEIGRRFIALAEAAFSGRILVLPMASAEPAASGAAQVKEFQELGAKSAGYRILTREEALKPETAALLDGVGGVYFTGGDQARVTQALGGTPFQARLLEAYRAGAAIGGSSAGAAIMSQVMITGDEVRKPEEGREFSTLEAGNVITVPGLGFISAAVIDQHFATRKRHNRLISVLAEHPGLVGIGIDEGTAVVVAPDETFEVIGDRNVVVYDPGQARFSIAPDKSVGVVGLTMHVLRPGQGYDLKTRAVLSR